MDSLMDIPALITGLRASSNNRGETVLDLFLSAIATYACPVRLRGDHGVENILVAAWMEANMGRATRRPYIWGRCVVFAVIPVLKFTKNVSVQECT